MKTCSKCGERKTLGEFYRDAAKRDGHASTCKRCSNARARAWGAQNPDRLSAIQKKARERDQAARSAEWRRRHPEEARAIANRQNRRRVQELHPTYVAQKLIRGSSMRVGDVPDELIQQKRDVLLLKRVARALFTASKPQENQ